MNFKEIANQLLRLFLIVFTSFWNATIHIVWGITTIFLLVGLLNYFNADKCHTIFIENNRYS